MKVLGYKGWMEMLYRRHLQLASLAIDPAEFGQLLIIVLHGTNIHIVFI